MYPTGWVVLTHHGVHPSVHTALKKAEVEECVRWMVPFAMALREFGGSPMKTFAGIPADDMHNIQSHAPYLTWLVSESTIMNRQGGKNVEFMKTCRPERSRPLLSCGSTVNLHVSAVFRTRPPLTRVRSWTVTAAVLSLQAS